MRGAVRRRVHVHGAQTRGRSAACGSVSAARASKLAFQLQPRFRPRYRHGLRQRVGVVLTSTSTTVDVDVSGPAVASNGNGVHANGIVVGAEFTDSPPAANGVALEVADACSVGQLGSCAMSKDGADSESLEEAPESRWDRLKSVSGLRRSLEIWGFVLQFIVRFVSTKLKFTYGKAGMTKEAIVERKRALAVWLREGLVKLGPTFIKIGQQFSTRVDVLSPEVERLAQPQARAVEGGDQRAVARAGGHGEIDRREDALDVRRRDGHGARRCCFPSTGS